MPLSLNSKCVIDVDDDDTEDFQFIKRKWSEKAKAKELRDGIKATLEHSIALYCAMLTHHGGFLEDSKDMKLSMEALAEACKKTKNKVANPAVYNDLTNLVILSFSMILLHY